MQKYTDGQYIHHAEPMTNHEFMVKTEGYEYEHLAHLPLEDGYFVQYQDETIECTSWYPKEIFEQRFTLVENSDD